jgi:hypothetical protein
MTEADLPELHRRLIAMRQELVAELGSAPDQLGPSGWCEAVAFWALSRGVTFALLHCSMG